jgi:uncharacterized OB-fold protein
MSNSEKTKKIAPAIEGWFTMGDEPQLLGSQCRSCSTYFFPKESFFCRNPDCEGEEFDEVALSRRGKLWSYTNAGYTPPPPFIAPDPYRPFAIAAVELGTEKIVILGQVDPDIQVDALTIGMEMELELATLFEDEENSYQTWRWKPVAA